jgi:hypothetical protein
MIFTANISHAQEVPVTPDRGFSGFATFFLNDAMTSLSFFATVFGLDITGSQTADTTDNLAAAHIHAAAPPGTNASVVFGFFPAPSNDTSGDVVITPFPNSPGGTFFSKWDVNEGNNTTLTAQLPNILAGNAYINFHTAAFPGGEIRGQITPVPEPATLTLIGVCALGLLSYGWRRRK